MKYEFRVICDSPVLLPDTKLHGSIADAMARQWLQNVTISRLRIENIDQPVIGDVRAIA